MSNYTTSTFDVAKKAEKWQKTNNKQLQDYDTKRNRGCKKAIL